MENPHFVLIPCRVCHATTVVLGDRRRPVMCARCRAPYDAGAVAFGRGTMDTAADQPTPTSKAKAGPTPLF